MMLCLIIRVSVRCVFSTLREHLIQYDLDDHSTPNDHKSAVNMWPIQINK